MINNIFLDVDDTVFNSLKRCVQLHDESKINDWDKIDDWNLRPVLDIEKQEIIDLFDEPTFYQDIEYLENCKKYINKLYNYFDIYFITAGTPVNRFNKLIKLNEEFPDIDVITIPHMKNKKILDLSNSVLIDDHPIIYDNKHLENIWIYEPGISKKWNHGLELIRIHSWPDIYEKLMDMK